MIRSGVIAGLLSLAFVSGMYVQAAQHAASARPLLPPLGVCGTPAPFTTYTPTPLPTPAPFTTYTPTPALSK